VKLLVTAQGTVLESAIDPRFGRAQHFIVYDTETRQATAHSNQQNMQAVQGAGIQAGRQAVDLGAEAVLTGHVGPKAFSTLEAAGVAVYAGLQGTVQEAIDQFLAGALEPSRKADVSGHWM
jgi:predicted Fe-Mo cluster-binding NifX family protein